MMEDELDRMLAKHDEIVPSSGFVMSVMDAVRREAQVHDPAPLPPLGFPWMRAAPVFIGLAAALVMLLVASVEIARMPIAAVSGPLLSPIVRQLLVQANAGWIVGALLLTFFSTLFSMRFAVGRR
jgi:hypothetical protein